MLSRRNPRTNRHASCVFAAWAHQRWIVSHLSWPSTIRYSGCCELGSKWACPFPLVYNNDWPDTSVTRTCWGGREDGDSTNAMHMASSGVDPGRRLVSNETCPSPIGVWPDEWVQSCDFLDLSSPSVSHIRRMMDAAVWGGGTEAMLIRPTQGLAESAGSLDSIAPLLS
jgi:hypothetical protein